VAKLKELGLADVAEELTKRGLIKETFEVSETSKV